MDKQQITSPVSAIDKTIQAHVDLQVMELGMFTPLELLIRSGHLSRDDYERWLKVDIESLDEVLPLEHRELKSALQQSVQYATLIGLIEENQAVNAGNGGGAMPRRMSADRDLERLITLRFRPPKRPQADMFFDNPVTVLTNGMIAALAAADAVESRRQWRQLQLHAPDHPELAGFATLCSGLEARSQPRASSGTSVQQKLHGLQDLSSIAIRLLGARSHDYLRILWRDLALALNGYAFDKDHPELHSSHALAQAKDWQGVIEAIQMEVYWWLHAGLCQRLAEARSKLGDRPGAIAACCHLCWHTAEATAYLRQRGQFAVDIQRYWKAFEETEDLLELEVPLPATEFPAWLLLTEPGLVHALGPNTPFGRSSGEEAFRIIGELILARQAQRRNEEIELRKQLLAGYPGLFQYMKQQIGS